MKKSTDMLLRFLRRNNVKSAAFLWFYCVANIAMFFYVSDKEGGEKLSGGLPNGHGGFLPRAKRTDNLEQTNDENEMSTARRP